ncbi:MAG: hypothetical protein ABW034_17745 [Steroidobacteraceae bacterium]
MCYDETFFQRWARHRAQRREDLKSITERSTPASPQNQPAEAAPVRKNPVKEVERELEDV